VTLSLQNISLSYGTTEILHDLSFTITKSEIVAIVGPNGSGKTSLLRCINRLIVPQKGRILLNNINIFEMKQREIARNFSYVPQNFQAPFPTKVFETILMGRRPYAGWRPTQNDIKKVAEIMKLVKIEKFALKSQFELSGGEYQKVLVACAFVQESSVILLDEPTSQLDIMHQLEIMDILKEIVMKREMLSIVVMHDLNLAARYADRIIMLHNGGIFAVGSPKEVLTAKNILSVYGVNSIIMHDGDIPCIVATSCAAKI
jgi:iron complex transport system ATP-binding protein